jgi:hypothetical protein
MAGVLQTLLELLRIEHKLLATNADNATNNESFLSELYLNFTKKAKVRFSTWPRMTKIPHAFKKQTALFNC